MKLKPYKHQLDGVEFAKDKQEVLFLMGLGSGKTGTAILTAEMWAKLEGRPLKTLVICPPVVMFNWQDEFTMFSELEKQNILVLGSGTGKRKAEIVLDNLNNPEKQVIVVNYEALLGAELFTAIGKFNPDLIIMDEIHYCKNSTSKRSKLCAILTSKAKYKLGLTGTPILNSCIDIFGIFRAVDCGKTFGTNKFVFQSKYMIDKNARNPHVNFPNWISNPITFPELNEKTYRKSYRVLTKDCIDLPDLIKIIRNVDFGSDQKKAYMDLKKEFLAFIESQNKDGIPESVTANLAIVKALRLLQIASGFVQTDSGDILEFKEVPRLDATEELLEEITSNNEKCIVWCAYRHNYSMISKVCDKLKIKYVTITGEQSTIQKREAEQAFQNDFETKIMIANPSAGGSGVNLTAAAYSIVYSRTFNLAHSLQSEARNYRNGSNIHDKITKIDLAIKGTVDEVALVALNNKEQISRNILDLIK